MFRKLFSLRKQIHLLVLFCIHACSFQRKRRILIVQFQRHIKTQVKESILYISNYTDANFKMNDRYRKNSSDVAEYLRNRPRKVVKHCLKKILLANSDQLLAISIVKNGVTTVNIFQPFFTNFMHSNGMLYHRYTLIHLLNIRQFRCERFFGNISHAKDQKFAKELII